MENFWAGFEKRALSPEFLQHAASVAKTKAQTAFMRSKPGLTRFMQQSERLSQGAAARARGVFKGVAQKSEPATIDYAANRAAEVAKRKAAEASAPVLNYAGGRGPTYTPPTPPKPAVPKQPDPATWSKINQSKRARSLEQERTGVVRD